MKNIVPVLLAIFVLLSMPVMADYNQLLQAGVNSYNNYNFNGNSVDDPTFTEITTTASTSGSYTAPIVFDGNGDGVNEVFVYGGNNITNIFSGNNVKQEQASIITGEPRISPVACDIDGDADLEYVGVFNNGTAYTLTWLDYSTGAIVRGDAVVINNQTSPYGKLVCYPFFATEGDNRNYVMFVDIAKRLYYGTSSGGSWVFNSIDSENSMAHELETERFLYGDDDVVIMEDSGYGYPIVAWMSGWHLHGMRPDLEGFTYDFDAEIISAPNLVNRGYIGARKGQAGADKIVIGTGQINVAGVRRDVNLMLFKVSLGFFGGNSWGLDASITKAYLGSLTQQGHTTWSLGTWFPDGVGGGDGTDDIIMYYSREYKQGSQGNYITVWDGNDLTELHDTFVPTTICGSSFRPFLNRQFYVDMNADGIKDIVHACRNGTSGTDWVYWAEGGNFTTMHEINVWDFTIEGLTPYPVDYNNDGAIDFIHSDPSHTRFLQSSVESQTVRDYPFSIRLNNTVADTTRVEVEAEYWNDNEGSYDYNYALVCSIQSQSIWTETFGLGYNFTENNVDVFTNPTLDPNTLLGVGGISFNIGTNLTNILIEKVHDEGVRDTMSLSLSYADSGNSIVDVYGLADDDLFTELWRINKTGTNVEVYKVVPGQGQITVGLGMVTSDFVRFVVNHKPQVDEFNNIRYFTTDLYLNEVLINDTTSTFQFNGENLKRVSIYTNAPANYTISQLSLQQTTDVEPPFVGWQNGIVTTEQGVTLTVPSPAVPFVQGQGFRAIPDYNEFFYGECSYEEAGTYLQRHYIAPINVPYDYTNFREIYVTITDPTTEADETPTGGFEDDPFFDELVSGLPESLQGTFGRFMLWLFFAFILIVVGFAIHFLFGLFMIPLALLIGILSGALPLWIAVLLVIFAGGILALVFRRVFAGGN